MALQFNKSLVIGGNEWKTEPFKFYGKNDIWNIGGGTPEPTWQDVILSGNTALTLVNAKADGLNYVKLFGKCEFIPENYIDSVTLYGKCSQSSTPTPSTPVDIVCNNGTLKCNRVINTYNGAISSSGTIISSSSYNINVAPVEANKTYTVFGMSVYALFTELPVMGSTSYDGSRVVSSVTSLTIPDDSTIKYIAYRTATTTNGVLYSNDEPIYADGTVETVTDDVGNTATAEMLLKVGNYTDEQSIIDGAISRKVGAIVLDGTESWSYDSTYERFTVTITDCIKGLSNRKMPLLCSHYPVISDGRSVANVPYNSIYGTNTNSVFIKTADYTTVEDFTAFLAQQYSNGTPVIIVYPLNETTPSAAFGQELHKTPITITGALADLEDDVVNSVHTEPYPLQPLKIACNNGVLKSTKNLFNQDLFQTDVETTVTYVSYKITNGTYTMSTNMPGASTGNIANVFFLAGQVQAGVNHNDNGVFLNHSITQTITDGYYTVAYRSKNSSSPTYNPKDYNWQLEVGSIATNYTPFGQIIADGTVETVEVDRTGDTATAENLLKVNETADVQNITTGEITRGIYTLVLTGDETFTSANIGERFRYWCSLDPEAKRDGVSNRGSILCTHFRSVHTSTEQTPGYGFTNSSRLYLIPIDQTQDTATKFTDWLKAQYAEGTPVIVCYPLKTSTTETVTAQTNLTTQRGTNVIEITQASIDELPLEVSYKAGVSVAITEVQNAQLDNNVEVTING